jgi:hypothetical protein
MDATRREQMKRHLAQADRHIGQGETHITKQISLIGRLDLYGHDSTEAREFLALLLDSQQMHEDHREQIIRELAA